MNWITTLGLIAATFTTVCQIPQAIKAVKTRHTKDISLATYLILTIGVILWLIYGLQINDLPLIIANAITVFLTGTILVCKIRYK